jgi:hypothetical protein
MKTAASGSMPLHSCESPHRPAMAPKGERGTRRSPNFLGCNWPTSARTDRFANDQHHPPRPHPTAAAAPSFPRRRESRNNLPARPNRLLGKAAPLTRWIPACAGMMVQSSHELHEAQAASDLPARPPPRRSPPPIVPAKAGTQQVTCSILQRCTRRSMLLMCVYEAFNFDG